VEVVKIEKELLAHNEPHSEEFTSHQEHEQEENKLSVNHES
jgi:hypothetical protein